jgi:O-antigen/teichoic acid export membrane protein
MTDVSSRRMARNALVTIVGNYASRLFDIVSILLLARYLGVERFGFFTFAFSLVGLFSIFVDWGTTLILVRETAREDGPSSRLLGSGLTLKLALALAATAILGVVAAFLRYPDEVRLLVVIVALNLVVSFRMPSFKDIFDVPLTARLKMNLAVRTAILCRLLTLLGVVFTIVLRAPLWAVGLVYTLAALPAFLLLVRYSTGVLRPDLGWHPRDWKYLLREGVPLGLGTILYLAFNQVDLLLLTHYRTSAEVGLYGAARRLTEPLELVSVGLGLTLLPVMSRVGPDDKARLARLYRKSVVSLLLIALPLSFFLLSFARPLVRLLFGPEFAPAARSLGLLGSYLPFIFVYQMGTCVFIAVRRQQTNSLIWLGGLALCLAANAVLIPASGFIGASWTRFATGVAVGGASAVLVRRLLGPVGFKPVIAAFILAAGLALPLRLLLAESPAIAFTAFVALFAAGAAVLRIVTAEDVRFLKAEVLSVLKREPDRLAEV